VREHDERIALGNVFGVRAHRVPRVGKPPPKDAFVRASGRILHDEQAQHVHGHVVNAHRQRGCERQIAPAHSASVKYGVGDRRRRPHDPDLADALGPHGVELGVVLVDELHPPVARYEPRTVGLENVGVPPERAALEAHRRAVHSACFRQLLEVVALARVVTQHTPGRLCWICGCAESKR